MSALADTPRSVAGYLTSAVGRVATPMLRPLVEPVRLQVQQALRRRVAGDNYATDNAKIFNTPGPRWFTPDDPIWIVHNDAAMFPGGVRALLLQSLHPRAMAAVAQHSGFRSDPWGRLSRTSRFIATTTYGTVADAERAIDVVRAVHARVNGVTSDGQPYSADDPHLLAWVHATEVDSFLAAYQAYGQAPLDDADRDTYVAQTSMAAERLGVIDPPQTYAALQALIDGYRSELRVGNDAREATHILLVEPPLPRPARPAYLAIAAGSMALLPAWARRLLPLPLGLRRLPAAGATGFGRFSTAAIRWAITDRDA